ncbi:MAG: hypothetical protein HY043_14245 [Verrucomicrobia bacterium]|nr:hypothetical protein [Verrucomicrobiota bacterium]
MPGFFGERLVQILAAALLPLSSQPARAQNGILTPATDWPPAKQMLVNGKKG